ncbi:type II CAAX endopeptidase family protein [Pseudarthrobacter sp. PS3-L1]|uniref:CPBP family intramembrane glutamic endopeptidase n=1 Tax=Pseudarthrobacter sp. PS3-L1 TaxID=3046207 RepID=UPI0024B97347|nr:type II CAAX endopeptidase family protein [Pseudarthrobacter sp. PS3-L1]MDJ0319291.1 type II CAAX endopeptidase family protein [Pseudarthrobacter sp. PS3-L1]
MTTTRTPPAQDLGLYRFSGLDYTAAALYLAALTGFTLAGNYLLGLIQNLGTSPAATSYAANLIFYGVVGIFAVLAARRVLVRDTRVLATRPWFTLLMIPTAVIAMLVLTAIVVAVGGAPETSANQAGIQALMQQVPAWLIVPLLVLVGPFVEEYIFRHLLIGKLGRYLNVWLCCVLSVVLFAALHIVGQEAITLTALLPYLAMGVVLVAVYMWTGRNVVFSYLVHAAKNLLSVVLIYAISPELMEQLQQVQG